MSKVTGPRSYLKFNTIETTKVAEMGCLVPNSTNFWKAEVIYGQDNFSSQWVYKPVVSLLNSNHIGLGGSSGEYYTEFEEATRVAIKMMEDEAKEHLENYNEMCKKYFGETNNDASN